MEINETAVMLAVTVIGILSAAVARGRWQATMGLMLGVTVVMYPLTYLTIERMGDAPGGWVRTAFQIGTSALVAVVLSPLHHRLRRDRRVTVVSRDTDGGSAAF